MLLVLVSSLLAAQEPACPPPVGHIDLRSGTYRSRPGVTFELKGFSASLVPQSDKAPLCWQKFTVVSRASIFVSNDSLTKVFAEKLGSTETKIKDFSVVNSAGGVTLSGTIKKVVPIHFSIFGPVTTDGKVLLMHAQTIKADGVPLKMVLGMVGEHLSSVLGIKDVPGVVVEGDTMSFSPEQVAHLKGNLHAVTTSDAGITLVYTPRASAAAARKPR